MGMPANPAGARLLVAPRITKMKPAVSTSSAVKAAASEYLPGE